MQERLQKIIARAGIASRREAEHLIEEGLVTVNGKVAHLGDKADLAEDHVKVKGRLLPKAESDAHFLFYKPRGVLTAVKDAEGRLTVGTFFQGEPCRVFPVGRLDMDSEGLLVVTNDGELAHGLMHPSSRIPKCYRVKTKGVPGERALELLRRGVHLEDGRTAPAQVRLLEKTRTNAWFEVIIHEGRNRQIRRLFEHIHHSVLKLKRTGYAFLKVGALEPGTYRRLTSTEVERLRALVAGPKGTPAAARGAAPKPKRAPAARPAAKPLAPKQRPKRPPKSRTRTHS